MPPLFINGQASLLNMGFRIFNKTWLSTTLSNEDCLLNPDKCLKGFSIGIKVRIDLSVSRCKQPRYILDTGPSLKSQGVSIYVNGNMLVARVISSKGTWQVCKLILHKCAQGWLVVRQRNYVTFGTSAIICNVSQSSYNELLIKTSKDNRFVNIGVSWV